MELDLIRKLLGDSLLQPPAGRPEDPFAGDFDPQEPLEYAVVEALDYLSMRAIKDRALMSEGNAKLDKRVLIFNLPPIKSCPNNQSCRDSCYAVPFYRQYPNVWEKCDQNFLLAKNKLPFLAGRLLMQIVDKKKTRAGLVAVRVHSSGDFFSQDYLNMWTELARSLPDVKFYAYTKADKVLDFSRLDKVENFNVIRSFIGGKMRNYGTPDYIKKVLARYPDASICPAIHNRAIHCGGECNYCISGDKPLFFIHGKMKKAGGLREHRYDWTGLAEEQGERAAKLAASKKKKKRA